jgi:hypothetical protein
MTVAAPLARTHDRQSRHLRGERPAGTGRGKLRVGGVSLVARGSATPVEPTVVVGVTMVGAGK